MKKFVTLFIIILLCSVRSAEAQNFLNNLQKEVPGEGKISVHQSTDIDELVNGKSYRQAQYNKKNNTEQIHQTQKTKHPQSEETSHKTEEIKHSAMTGHQQEKKTETHVARQTEEKRHDNNNIRHETQKTESSDSEEFNADIPTVDLRKKMMRKSYKVTGFRVQAYAGGNKRTDRQKAERIGNDIKMNYPDEPVYVHFYSPRWICRIGNYRSYNEAHRMLLNIRRLGYKQSCIVKGKVSVQY